MASKRSKPAECSLLFFGITSSVNSSDVRVFKIIFMRAISLQQFNVFTSNWVQRFLRGLGILACTLLLPQSKVHAIFCNLLKYKDIMCDSAHSSIFNKGTIMQPVLYTRLVVQWDGAGF